MFTIRTLTHGTVLVEITHLQHRYNVQWKLANKIALGQRETDNTNTMITFINLIRFKRVICGKLQYFL